MLARREPAAVLSRGKQTFLLKPLSKPGPGWSSSPPKPRNMQGRWQTPTNVAQVHREQPQTPGYRLVGKAVLRMPSPYSGNASPWQHAGFSCLDTGGLNPEAKGGAPKSQREETRVRGRRVARPFLAKVWSPALGPFPSPAPAPGAPQDPGGSGAPAPAARARVRPLSVGRSRGAICAVPAPPRAPAGGDVPAEAQVPGLCGRRERR